MSSSFNSEIMEDELNTVLLNLTPEEVHPLYTSLEGWLDLTPEAQGSCCPKEICRPGKLE